MKRIIYFPDYLSKEGFFFFLSKFVPEKSLDELGLYVEELSYVGGLDKDRSFKVIVFFRLCIILDSPSRAERTK